MVAASTTRRFGSYVALFTVLVAGGCFDSDEKFTPRSGTTTGEPDPTTTTGDGTSSTGGPDGTTGEPDFTCRDAVVCIQQCAFELALNPGPEPDLGCLLDCVEENLTVRETYHLLRLSNCAADACESRDECMSEGDTDGGGSSSSSGGDEGGDDGGGLIDPCLQCVFLEMSNPEPTVCVEFHELCNEMPDE